MTLSSLVLGLCNVAIWVAILVLVALIAEWILSYVGLTPPEIIRRVVIIIIGLIALYLIIALLLGHGVPGPIAIPAR